MKRINQSWDSRRISVWKDFLCLCENMYLLLSDFHCLVNGNSKERNSLRIFTINWLIYFELFIHNARLKKNSLLWSVSMFSTEQKLLIKIAILFSSSLWDSKSWTKCQHRYCFLLDQKLVLKGNKNWNKV